MDLSQGIRGGMRDETWLLVTESGTLALVFSSPLLRYREISLQFLVRKQWKLKKKIETPVISFDLATWSRWELFQ